MIVSREGFAHTFVKKIRCFTIWNGIVPCAHYCSERSPHPESGVFRLTSFVGVFKNPMNIF